MVLVKEYRILLPFTLEEFRVGEVYMAARSCLETTHGAEGVEVIENKECEDQEHGKGRFTRKHLYLSSRLPSWIRRLVPKMYLIEQTWTYYPYAVTKIHCSMFSSLRAEVESKVFDDDRGSFENVFNLPADQLLGRTVDYIDIAYDELSPQDYKEEEDPKNVISVKSPRGPLGEKWQETVSPVICVYKLVQISFDVIGLRFRVEKFIQGVVRNVCLLTHRKAFAWLDEWIDMSLEEALCYEKSVYAQLNAVVRQGASNGTL